jgi:protein-disulfide isomerase
MSSRGLFGVFGAVILFFVLASQWYEKQRERQPNAEAKNSEVLVRPYSPVFGAANAKVTLVEFLDPECETCGTIHPMVKNLVNEFDGELRLVVRYMPFHENSVDVAYLLEAAREQKKFWEALALFFSKQPEWARHEDPRPELLLGYLESIGVNMERINNSLELEPEPLQRIQQDYDDGVVLNVVHTPTFFVNGRMVDGIDYQLIKSAIRREL